MDNLVLTVWECLYSPYTACCINLLNYVILLQKRHIKYIWVLVALIPLLTILMQLIYWSISPFLFAQFSILSLCIYGFITWEHKGIQPSKDNVLDENKVLQNSLNNNYLQLTIITKQHILLALLFGLGVSFLYCYENLQWTWNAVVMYLLFALNSFSTFLFALRIKISFLINCFYIAGYFAHLIIFNTIYSENYPLVFVICCHILFIVCNILAYRQWSKLPNETTV